MAEKTALQVRVLKSFVTQLDDWRRKQTPIPSRSQAIRSLVSDGIAASKKGKKSA